MSCDIGCASRMLTQLHCSPTHMHSPRLVRASPGVLLAKSLQDDAVGAWATPMEPVLLTNGNPIHWGVKVAKGRTPDN